MTPQELVVLQLVALVSQCRTLTQYFSRIAPRRRKTALHLQGQNLHNYSGPWPLVLKESIQTVCNCPEQ